MTAVIDAVNALMERPRQALVVATSRAEYEWAYRCALNARIADQTTFAVHPVQIAQRKKQAVAALPQVLPPV